MLERLRCTLEAECSFATNAAHELRTPVAAALAQIQRLQAESAEDAMRKRVNDVEASLKRQNRLLEKLMQMARVEGANLRVDTSHDLVQILKMVVNSSSCGPE